VASPWAPAVSILRALDLAGERGIEGGNGFGRIAPGEQLPLLLRVEQAKALGALLRRAALLAALHPALGQLPIADLLGAGDYALLALGCLVDAGLALRKARFVLV
jgi:hypothetical protein